MPEVLGFLEAQQRPLEAVEVKAEPLALHIRLYSGLLSTGKILLSISRRLSAYEIALP